MPRRASSQARSCPGPRDDGGGAAVRLGPRARPGPAPGVAHPRAGRAGHDRQDRAPHPRRMGPALASARRQAQDARAAPGAASPGSRGLAAPGSGRRSISRAPAGAAAATGRRHGHDPRSAWPRSPARRSRGPGSPRAPAVVRTRRAPPRHPRGRPDAAARRRCRAGRPRPRRRRSRPRRVGTRQLPDPGSAAGPGPRGVPRPGRAGPRGAVVRPR